MSDLTPVANANRTVVDALIDSMERFRSRKVVRVEEREMSYEELDLKSRCLALKLLALGLEPGSRIGVCLKPCLEVMTAIVAIYRSAMVYVPIDPTHPKLYIEHMLQIARPQLILCHDPTKTLVQEMFPSVLSVDEHKLKLAEEKKTQWQNIQPLIKPEMMATIFFTSGTTGKPKAVPLTHGNIAFFVESARKKYQFKATDLFTSIARYTFSISLFDLLGAATSGAQVWLMERDKILSPSQLVQVLRKATVVHAGPSLLGSLFRYLRFENHAEAFDHLRHVSSGGDVVSPAIMEEMRKTFPKAELFVIYGCTEISCMGTTYSIPAHGEIKGSYVGRPFEGVDLVLLDPENPTVEVAEGAIGEIAFAGPGVTPGYLGLPELSQEKFVMQGKMRFYRTGDLGRFSSSGDLEILGRQDFQIQLRGIRIELIGIENTIKEKNLAENAALVFHKELDDERLIAFVVAPRCESIRELRHELAKYFPEYMLPHVQIPLDKLPLTANGKLDRQALKILPWKVNNTKQPVAENTASFNMNEVERKIAGIFEELLHQKVSSPDDNFFERGGHSLLAVMAIQNLQNMFGERFRPADFFRGPTISSLAKSIQNPQGAADDPVALAAGKGNKHINVFMVSGVHLYEPLAHHLAEHMQCFGIFSSAEASLTDTERPKSVTETAQSYLQMIGRMEGQLGQKTGSDNKDPCILIGYSFGGIIAFEMAQILRKNGKSPKALILIDAVLPEWVLGLTFRKRQLQRIFRRPFRDFLRFTTSKIREHFTKNSPPLADLRYQGHLELKAIEAKRDLINHEASAHYLETIESYPGPVLLFVSGERLRRDPLKSRSCGWHAFIDSLEIVTVETDHYSMVEKEPYVSQVAKATLDFLARMEVRSS